MASIVTRPARHGSRGHEQSLRILVVGREGVRQLAEYLVDFFFAGGRRVDSLLGFDFANRVVLCQVEVGKANSAGYFLADLDVVVVLSSSGVRYERHLRVDGTLVLETSEVAVLPMRQDINVLAIPAEALAQRAVAVSQEKLDGVDQEDLERCIMLGAVLAVAEETLESKRLHRLFLRFHDLPVLSLVMAADEGYDWVQDIRMRGKSRFAVVGQ